MFYIACGAYLILNTLMQEIHLQKISPTVGNNSITHSIGLKKNIQIMEKEILHRTMKSKTWIQKRQNINTSLLKYPVL